MPLEPPQQPQLKPKLRLMSVPTAVDPALGWRFLRHMRYEPVAMSHSTPSGLTIGTTQISRESTMPLIRASVAYFVRQLVDAGRAPSRS